MPYYDLVFNLILAILFIVLCLGLLVTDAVMLVREWRERRRQDRLEQEDAPHGASWE
ncbi:hypothetical protein FACS189461_4500 [Spirochaetia bacterium]|nr:hypothetical protein FACS189461_4500 [Spirochaetia bacterium]